MSSGKPFRLRNTLAFRLTIWYAGIFTLSSFVAFLLFYTLITSVIKDRTDQELVDHAARFEVLFNSEGVQGVVKSAIFEAQAAGVRKVFFRLLYPDGTAFYSSNMSYWQDIDVDGNAVNQVLRGVDSVFRTVIPKGRKGEVRVLYVSLGPGVVMQIGRATEDSSRILVAFKGIFITTMVCLIILAAGVGWFMARRAVSAVEAVTRTARKISEGTLEERVPVKRRDDEIDQLATTFNEMLDRIQTLLKEMKEISDNIAHDLKSPITRIRGIAEITLTTGKSQAEFEGMAASTIEECDRLLDMINTMLLISRTEAGVDRRPFEEIDLSRLVESACELFGTAAEDKGVVLGCVAGDGIRTTGDRRMIQRMISNLIDNAIKYTPSGGRVDVVVDKQHDADGVRVVVADTGIGIPPEDLTRIFERFYRGDHSRSMAGMGLGLSLALAIARSHGGDITVVSRPDEGSTFTVILPP